MSDATRLFAFDVRRAPSLFVPEQWGHDRREQYLLRPDTKYPLSVSSRVWPCLFDCSDNETSAELSSISVEPGKNWYYDTFGVWNDLEEMRHVMGCHGTSGCGIAIGILPPDSYLGSQGSMTQQWLEAILQMPCNPAAPRGEWQRIGYDVADMGEISAVCDCGILDPNRREAWRQRWAGHVNEFGLFAKESDAREFCIQYANPNVPEHAPFLVYELFLMWGNEFLG